MKRDQIKMAILVEDLYQVLEVWYPLLRLKEEGILIQSIGTGTKETYGSKEGYPIKVDASIDKIKTSDYAGVIIPGGYAPDILRRFPKVVDFIREMDQAGKVVASICHGGWLLVSAGILRNRKATCFLPLKMT